MGLYDNPMVDPRAMALMTMGSGLMSGPSLMPQSFGANMGKAAMGGLQAFQQANQANQQQQLFAMKMAEAKRAEAERVKKEAAMAQLLQDPRFANMGSLLQVAPQQAIERAFPKDNKPVVVGRHLVDPENPTKPLFSAEEKPNESELTRLVRERDSLPQGDMNRSLYDAKIRKLTTHQPSTVVNNNMPKADSAYLTTRLKGEAESTEKLYSAADSAMKSNAALSRIAASNEDAYAGALAPVMAGAANLFASFGYDSKGLTNTTAIQQAASEMLANRMGELGARGLTDKDMQILRDNMPKVESSREARKMVVDVLRKANDGTITEAQNRRQQELKQYPELSSRTRQFSWEGYKPGNARPSKGDVIDGWEFIGGDPGNRMNWRKKK